MRKQPKTDSLSLFPIIIEAHEEGGFLASCPAIQGCRAEGETIGQAIDNIRDVIRTHLAARRKFSEAVGLVEVPARTAIRFTLPVPIGR